MSTEYQDSPKQKKRASSPKNGPAKQVRSTKRVSGYRPKARNALYQIAAEYRQRHPKATAAEAWAHLVAVAETGAHPVIVAHDPAADVLDYRPDVEKIAIRQIKFASFASRLSRLA